MNLCRELATSLSRDKQHVVHGSGVRAQPQVGVPMPVRKMASRARLLVSSCLGTVVPERLRHEILRPGQSQGPPCDCPRSGHVIVNRTRSDTFDGRSSYRAVAADLLEFWNRNHMLLAFYKNFVCQAHL